MIYEQHKLSNIIAMSVGIGPLFGLVFTLVLSQISDLGGSLSLIIGIVLGVGIFTFIGILLANDDNG